MVEENQNHDEVSSQLPNPQAEAVFGLVERYQRDIVNDLPALMEVVTVSDGEIEHISPKTAGKKEIPYAVVELYDETLVEVAIYDSTNTVAMKWEAEIEGGDRTMMRLGLKKAENELVTRNLDWGDN